MHSFVSGIGQCHPRTYKISLMILGREVDNLTKSLETGTSDFFQNNHFFEKKSKSLGFLVQIKKLYKMFRML